MDGVAFFPREFDVSPPPVQETVRQEGTHLIVGRTGGRQGELSAPADVVIDGDGNLWVADTNNHRISKYDSAGKYVSRPGRIRIRCRDEGAVVAHDCRGRGQSSSRIRGTTRW